MSRRRYTIGQARKLHRHSRRRGGALVVELLFNLPIWLILLLALVEFGELSANLQYVSMASRQGAERASCAAVLPAKGEVPREVLDAVTRQLEAAGLSCSAVIFEHNLGGSPAKLVSGKTPDELASSPLPAQGPAVRVTVIARTDGLAPNLLDCMGFDLASRWITQSTTYPYRAPVCEKRS